MKKNKLGFLWGLGIGLAILCFMGAFFCIKLTTGAEIVACLQEQISFSEYVQCKAMPDNENFGSHKEKVVNQIRRDKATKKREAEEKERIEFVSDKLSALAEKIKSGYMFFSVTNIFEENQKIAQDYMNAFSVEGISKTENEMIVNFEGEIIGALSYNWSTDVYFPGEVLENVQMATKEYVKKMTEVESDTDIIIEQIKPGEYDPVPPTNMAEGFSEDISCVERDDEQAGFDYILEYTKNYESGEGEKILSLKIVAIAGPEKYKILELDTNLFSADSRKYIPSGNVRIFAQDNQVNVNRSVKPIVLNVNGMEEKATQFVQFLKNIFKLFGRKDQTIEQLYEIFVEAIEAEENVSESTEGETDPDIEKADYDSLLLNISYSELEKEIEDAYSKETEWGVVSVLKQYLSFVYDEVQSILMVRYLNEHPGKLEENGISSETFNQCSEEANIISQLVDMPEPVLVESEVLFPGEVSQTSSKNYEDLFQSLSQGYEQWCEKDCPESVYGGRFKYSIEGFCTVEVKTCLTTEEIYIIDYNIQWLDDETAFEEMSGSRLLNDVGLDLYQQPNYFKMEEEARAAVDESQYQLEEEYQRAIAVWLYEQYPQYYQDPNQYTSNANANANASNGSGMYNGLDIFTEMSRSVKDVWDSVGYETEGSLFGYLFTNNGNYRSFADDVKDGIDQTVDTLGNAISKTKDNIVEGWRNLWR